MLCDGKFDKRQAFLPYLLIECLLPLSNQLLNVSYVIIRDMKKLTVKVLVSLIIAVRSKLTLPKSTIKFEFPSF